MNNETKPKAGTTRPAPGLTPRSTMIIAGLLGLLGVAAGAFGAHGLKPQLSAEELGWWQTAARYQQIHAVALLLVGWGAGPWTRARRLAAACFCVGIALFCASLYAMALGGPRVLGAVTPLGGLALLAGWGLIIAHARKISPSPSHD